MVQDKPIRNRHREDEERNFRNSSSDDVHRRYDMRGDYPDAQFEYGREAEQRAAQNRSDSYRGPNYRDNNRWAQRNRQSSDYDSGSSNYGTASYGSEVYGESGEPGQYMGGGGYGEGSVGSYGQRGPRQGGDFYRGFGIEQPPLGGNRHHFGERPGNGYRERGMWDRATDEVASWFGDEDAEHRRRLDDFRGRGPKNYTRSSDRIREDVSDRLADDWQVDASDIEVSVSGTEVTLDGTVYTRGDKRRAEDCADSVSGVTHVQNNLRVKPSGTTATV